MVTALQAFLASCVIRRGQASQSKKLNLLIERSTCIQDRLSSTFALLGYHVVCIADGKKAIARIEQASAEGEPSRGVLLDFTRQSPEGQTFLDRACASGLTGRLPVVVLTTERGELHELGVPVIHKPFHIRGLLEVFDGLIAR